MNFGRMGAGFGRAGALGGLVNWILRAAFWNDTLLWNDTQAWKDS